jgi:ribose 5-phosphate isomerase B
MRIAVGSDHGGYELKVAVAAHLLSRDLDVVDVGVHERTSVDYPDQAQALIQLLLSGEADRGVLVCGTGQGMAMTANRVPGIRAAVVSDTFSASMASAHNNAQVLCLGERIIGVGLALQCVDAWLDTEYEGGRHDRRLGKMAAVGQLTRDVEQASEE